MKIKNIIPIALLLFLFSCAKNEEIVLEKDLNAYDYFPEFDVRLEYESGSNRTSLGVANFQSEYTSFGRINFSNSYLYSSDYSSMYSEFIKAKKSDLNEIKLKITEKHHSIDINNSEYDVQFSPYYLNILKKDLKLNDKWESTSEVEIKYIQGYYSPYLMDKIDTVHFNYEVIGIYDDYSIYNNSVTKTYENVISILVNYTIENQNVSRVYRFSEGIGLIELNLNGLICQIRNI